jgi:hypothetical protein
MADKNANNSTEKTTSIDKPRITINPITGLPFGGGTINPETNQPDTNPITGKKFGLGLVNSEGKANYGGYSPDFPTLGGKGFSPSNIFTDTYTMYNQEPMENYKKYGVPMGRHFDWDELRARNQSAGETVMNGIGKSLVTYGGALLENTIGFFAGLGEMATGGAYYDNAIGKTVDKWNNWAQEAMPIYLTEAEQNHSTWQKMGTAHFWADDVLGGMAYTAAAATALYLTGGGGLLTKGAGAAASMAFGRTALWNTTKAVINGTKLSTDLAKGAALTSRLFTAAQVLEAGAMMSLAEASVEARETQKTTYDNLVQSYLEEHKTSNIDNIPKEKLKEFEEVSYNAGNTNFVMQMPVLMGTNLLMFGRSVSGFKVGSTINKDVIWNTATESYVSKLADKGFMSATLSKLKPFAQQGLNEAFQESYQFGSSAFAVSYHTDKYTNNGNGDISKALAAGWDAMGTQEGIESALIGFITGGVMGGGRAITSGQYSNRVEQADRLAGLANGGTLHNAAAMYQDANAASAASVDMEMHLKNGNIKGYQDARFNLIAAQSMEFLERGGLEMYIDQLQESSNLPDAEFKKLYGYLETDKHGDPISIEKQSNGKNKHEVIDGIVEKIREFEKTYDNVNERFPLPERTTGLPRLLANKENLLAEDKIYNERANLRNELIFLAAGVKDRNRRMSNIQNKIQETADDIYMYNRDSRGQTISMPDILDEQQPSHKGIKTWQEPGLKEKQDAFVDEQIGVDEQGNPIYAPGEKINPNVRLENQKIGAQPDRYNPNVQLIETQFKLKAVEDQIRQTDPLAADKIAELNKDYINLLTDNNGAIERYNQLSSDEFAQKQWTKALNAAIDQKLQQNLNDEAIKLASEAKTAKDISDNVNPGISPEAQDQVEERYEQLVKDEKAAYDKYYHQVATLPTSEDRLEALKDIDTENLTDSEKEGLRKAIATVTQQMKTEKLKNQSEDLKEEDTEVKETKKEIEEELSPENVGGVESISEDGRVFQIEGTQYYNRENNPTDAIIKDNNGEVVSIKLQNEQGDVQNIRGPQERIDALHYAILASEQYKIDSNQGIAQQDIVNRATVIIEENKKELKPTIKDAKKDSSSLRSEMYGLERSLDELLESQDQLRTSLIQDDSATKEDINANPTIKALKKQIKNTKAAITRRRNVLLNRNESVTPTITEITAVEQKSINDVSELTRKIAELDNQILIAEETAKRTEALMEQYQNDPGSFQQVSKENADAQDVINNSTEEIKQLYDLIEYKKQKLRRLENEKQNRPADPTKQTAPEDTGTTEKQITEGENPNTTTVPQEERITIAANLGYQRVNSNNYIVKFTEAEFLPDENQYEPGQAYFARIKNATDISIPGYSEVEAFTYKDQNGDTLVVDSLTGTVLGKNKNAKMAGKQAIKTLDQGNTTETFKTIIDQNQEVSPAYEPTNTIEEQENFTSSEKTTKKVITLEKGKIEIMDNTPASGPGQRGGKIVMTQAEVEEHDRQVSKDLSEVISEAPSSNSLIDKTSEKQRLELLEETLTDKAKGVVDLMRDKGKEQSMIDTYIRNNAKKTGKGNELLTNFQMEDVLSNPENYSEAVVVNAMKRHLLGSGPINTGNSERSTREMIPEIKQEIEEGIPLVKSEYDSKLLGTIAFQAPYRTGRDLAKGQTRYAYEQLIEEGIIKPTQPTTAPAQQTNEVKEGVSEVFNENSELAGIGTEQQYSEYLKTIFPDSKVKDIVYHSSLEKNIDKFRDSAYGIHFGTIQAGIDRIKGLQYSGDISDGGLSLTDVAKYIQRAKEDLAIFGFDEDTGKQTIDFPSDDEAIKHISKRYPSILNITSLKTTKDIGDDAQWKNKLNKINNTEGYSYQNLNEDKGSVSFVVKNSEQIHILGSKKDIKGFKDFVSKSAAPVAPTQPSTKNFKVTDIYEKIDDDSYSLAVQHKNTSYSLVLDNTGEVIEATYYDNNKVQDVDVNVKMFNKFKNELKDLYSKIEAPVAPLIRYGKESIEDLMKPIDFDTLQKRTDGKKVPTNISFWGPSDKSGTYKSETPGEERNKYTAEIIPTNPFIVKKSEVWTVGRLKSIIAKGHDAIIVDEGGTRGITETIPLDKSIIKLKDTTSLSEVEQQIKKSEYEVHVTGDMLSGWDVSTTVFNVPGIKINDLRSKSWDTGERAFDESIQNGKKVFTIVDGSIYRGARKAGISASMVFNENTTTTLEDVKGNLNALMDSLMGVKEGSSFTNENINFGWSKLDIKEIATPAVIQEESSREAKADPVEKTKMKPVVTKNARNNPETFKPWFIDTVSDSSDSKNTHKELVKLVQIGKNLDAKNTTWKIGDLAANVDGRPMVSIDIVETGESFIMYKSKGEGTGIESKGQWVPIPGFAKNGWFVKDMWNGANPKFSKYNINEFQEIADFLSIPGVGDAMVSTTPSAEIKPKKVYESNLSIPLANDTKVTRDFKHIPVTKDGLPISYNPDMLNKEEIEIDKSVLLDPNIMEKQVEFELILNDWFMKQYPQGVDATNWNQAPIYVKIDGKYIGKLDSKKTEEAQVLVEKLQAGEKVTTKINKIKANNFNWAMTEDGAHLFYNPNEVMEQGQVILAFTDVLDDNPYWTTSEVAESKRQGDLAQINQDIQYYDRKSARTNYGQVGVIIRAKNNPENISRVSVGTTQFLTPKAIDVVLESLKEKNHAKAATIVANSLLRDGANSETFLEFDTLQDQTRTMIYRSPKLNKLVRINEHELAKSLSGKTAKFGFVETYDNEGEIEYRPVKKDQLKNTDYEYIQDSLREDFKDFLTEKKYHVDRALGNTVGPYTSPVHGYKYNSYQEYLFAEREIGGERVEGLGHNSIFATDLVELNGSFFNNPLVEFGKGDLNGKTAETITNPVKPTGPIKPAKMTELERIARDMGLSEEDNTIPDCT